MSDIAELRRWLENEVDAGDESVQVWADKARSIEEQVEAAQRETRKEWQQAERLRWELAETKEQSEAWKTRAKAAEKVMLGTQEQLEAHDDALREIADLVEGWARPMEIDDRLELIRRILNARLSNPAMRQDSA